MAQSDRQEAVAEWAINHRNAEAVRVLLLTPTGRWAADLEMLCGAFPRARFEVYVALAAVAEVSDASFDRVEVKKVVKGPLSWILLSLRFSLAMKASPTVFFTGDRRLRVARWLSRSWLASDTVVVASMDSLVNALRAGADTRG
jgi:hypothetical protein